MEVFHGRDQRFDYLDMRPEVSCGAMNALLLSLVVLYQVLVPVRLVAPGKFELPLMRQPDGDSLYVSSQDGVGTLFQNAEWFGSVGVLAHDYLAGSNFYKLVQGDFLMLEYSDGSVATYQVEQVIYFTPSAQMPPEAMYQHVYTQPDRLILQTCTATGWLLIIAVPANYSPIWMSVSGDQIAE